jgi:hypothetical protein
MANLSVSKGEFEAEMQLGESCLAQADLHAAARHFGRAHNRGQQDRARHVRAHAALCRVAWRRCDIREVLAQMALLVGAAIFTMAGGASAGTVRQNC